MSWSVSCSSRSNLSFIAHNLSPIQAFAQVALFSPSWFEQGINFLPHAFIHLDQRRPGAFETFAGQYLRRVRFHFFLARRFTDCVAASASRSTGMVSLSLARFAAILLRSEEHTSELQSLRHLVCRL